MRKYKFEIEIEIGFGTRSDVSASGGRDVISPKITAAVVVILFIASVYFAKGMGAI